MAQGLDQQGLQPGCAVAQEGPGRGLCLSAASEQSSEAPMEALSHTACSQQSDPMVGLGDRQSDPWGGERTRLILHGCLLLYFCDLPLDLSVPGHC